MSIKSWRSSRVGGKGKYQAFRDSCVRQLEESQEGKMDIGDLMSGARTKGGYPIHSIPMKKGSYFVLRQDSRFNFEGEGVWSLAQDLGGEK